MFWKIKECKKSAFAISATNELLILQDVAPSPSNETSVFPNSGYSPSIYFLREYICVRKRRGLWQEFSDATYKLVKAF
jgi:hypothetical protein